MSASPAKLLSCRTVLAGAVLLLPGISQAAHLEFVLEVPGTISDVTPQRVLYMVEEDGVDRLKVLNRVSGSLRTIPDTTLEGPVGESLTSRGAIFGETFDLGAAIYEWSGSAPVIYEGTPRGMRVSPVSKQFAIWPVWRPGEGRYLQLRDTLARTTQLVGDGRVLDQADVSDAGDVVFTQGPAPNQVYRWRNGVTTTLTASNVSNFDPLTDGVNVVYRQQVSATEWAIVLHNESSGETPLRAAAALQPAAGADYLPRNGWVGFTRLNSVQGQTARQVWLRSPQGQITAISSAQADAYVHAVSPGQVMYVANGYLYLGKPGAQAELVAPFADATQAVWMQGQWYVYFGGALYRVVV